MNYLVHAFVSQESTEAIFGGLMGDFVKGLLHDQYPANIVRAIRLHRAVDAFADTNEIYRQSRMRLGSNYRRVSGIIIDLMYDHFLARHWPQFAPQELSLFTQRVYDALLYHRPLWPIRLQLVAPVMIQEDWLDSYRELESVFDALNGLSRRMKYATNLHMAEDVIRENYTFLEQDFFAFLPELERYCQQQKSQQTIAY
jgi:acyl carrier protein phosphodiesterase